MKRRTLAAVVVALAVVAGWAGTRIPGAADQSPGVERARAHVEKTCAGCHPGPVLDTLVRQRLARKDGGTLEAFLAGHHVPDPQLRAEVVAHLEARLAGSSSGS